MVETYDIFHTSSTEHFNIIDQLVAHNQIALSTFLCLHYARMLITNEKRSDDFQKKFLKTIKLFNCQKTR